MKNAFFLSLLLTLLVPGVCLSQSIGPDWVSEPCVPGLTVAVRDLPEYDPDPEGFGVEAKRRDDRGIIPPEVYVEPEIDILSIIQENAELRQSRAFGTPIVNVEGMDYGSYPPDPTGSVGASHALQGINGSGGSAVRILNKSGGTVSTFLMETLATSSPCTSGYCDPIVLYDWMADRWLISEFDSSGNSFCIYISATSDPTGSWYYYTWNPSLGGMQDYPKYGIWHDAYYISANNGGYVYAIDRNKMLNGQAATLQAFTLGTLSGWGFQLSLPASHAGDTAPPTNEPGIFLRQCDGAIHTQCSSDVMQMWELDIDWVTPSNSALTRITDVSLAAFDQTVCGTSSWECMSQPGTTQKLDPIREPLHQPVQYRNWGTYETIVGCFSVDVSGSDKPGIRWFELRRTTGNWYVHQQGTTPNDSFHRGVCSAAMDGDGNIAMGYTRTWSSTYYPSSFYAGRCAGDALGTLTFFDNVCYTGTGYQSANERWGDYSGISVDPADDATFWWFGMYEEGNNNNASRICSFRFDECGSSCDPISVTINSITPNPVCVNQQVSFSGSGSGEGALTYSWDFQNDGSYDATGANVNFTYTTANTYTARLRLMDSCSGPQTAYDTETVTVNPVPGAPSITTIVDESACAQSGIRITYTAGSSATSHNLLRDGTVVVTGYTSNALYNPGNTSSHAYRIQGVNTCGTTNSAQVSFTDVNNTPGAPAISSVTDINACALSGVSITFTSGSGATSHNLWVDGTQQATGISSPYTYVPGNSSSHSYVVRAINGTCWTNSNTVAGTDANNTPGAPTISSVTDINACALSGVSITFTSGSGATSHNLWVDGTQQATGITSPYTYLPGNSSSHSYVVRAINGTCWTNSNTVAGTDANNGVTTAPVITSIVDNDQYAQDGIFIYYTAGAPAMQHNLYDDGSLAVTNYVSGALYNPGDTFSHNYVIRAINGTCYANSAIVAGTDEAQSGDAPAEVTPLNWTNKTTIYWATEAVSTSYNLYRGLRANLANLANSNSDFCTRYNGASTSTTVAETAPVADCYYFIVTGVNAFGEGPAGTNSSGVDRQLNTTGACP